MTTPIYDFIKKYADSGSVRFHMPGHKGRSFVGFEPFDITEFDGADNLFAPGGIIRESEKNAGELFGALTFYSTEGSSLSIRAMLYLVTLFANTHGKKPVIAAGRNVHKTFITAAALLDFEIVWLYPEEDSSYLSCEISASSLERVLNENNVTAVYITSPDYLGSVQSGMSELAEICHRHGTLLAVDNAHGAYLRFLTPSVHPIDCGADMCCDSAHKTLPAVTGGGYLHISRKAHPFFAENAAAAISMFASTSPSYLIMTSLDLANVYLEGHGARLTAFLPTVAEYKKRIAALGYSFIGDEPLKLTFDAKKFGYTGTELAELLMRENIFSEFYDPDFLVLMVSPESGERDLERLYDALSRIERRTEITEKPPKIPRAAQAMTPREALFAPTEMVDITSASGRVSADLTAACPPAVPIVVCGERIDDDAVRCLTYYGTGRVRCCRDV